MNQNFYEAVEDNPIIAAVKSMEDVEECCKHDDIRVIFILFGDVCSIGSIVKTIRDAGKIAMVHMDLISGLSPKEIAVEFIKEQTEADGIISTKPSLIKKAKEMSMYTVLRVFLLDSMAFENIRQQQLFLNIFEIISKQNRNHFTIPVKWFRSYILPVLFSDHLRM